MKISLYFESVDNPGVNKINGFDTKYNSELDNQEQCPTGYLPDTLQKNMVAVGAAYTGKYYYPIYLGIYTNSRNSRFVKDPDFIMDIPENVIADIKSKKAKLLLTNKFEGNIHDSSVENPFIQKSILKPYNLSTDDLIFVTGNNCNTVRGCTNLVDNFFTCIIGPHDKLALIDVINNIYNDRPRDHKFICLQRKPHVHRVAIYAELYEIHHDGILTLGTGGDAGFGGHNWLLDNTVLPAVQKHFPTSYEKFLKVADTVPKTYDVDLSTENPLFDSDIEKFHQSYLHIVSETFFLNVDERMFFSEKIYKPMMHLQPFILFGQTGSLRALKAQGFKTFSDYIDESYDEIEDDASRFYTTLKSVKSFVKKDKAEMHLLMKEMIPILLHNYYNLQKIHENGNTKLLNDLEANLPIGYNVNDY
jgi:hypothetical protein